MTHRPPAFSPDRRTLIAASAAMAVTYPLAADAQTSPVIKLRLLETTDIHVNIANYDYYRDAPDDTVGLAKIASLVDAARKEAKNVFLFDNGDFNQGNPVGDYVALERGLKQGDIHPVIRAMNLLDYDAGTLGNHEFNYGLGFLDTCLAGANFPLACANIAKGKLGAGPRQDTPFINPYLIIERDVTDEAGGTHRIRIGVIGFTPPQIMMWDEKNLKGSVETRDIVETAAAFVPEMREAGVDLVVALAHTGISDSPQQGKDENAALYLARVPGIDVIMTGHQHQVFPGPNFARIAGADIAKGTLNGVPTVMGGFWGSHLGQVDLTLVKDGGKFRIIEHMVGTIPIFKRDAGKVVPLAEAKAEVVAAIRDEHDATLKYVRKPVGRTTERLETYLSLIEDSAALQIITEAQLWYAKRALAQTPHAGLPLLSAVAPFKAGGRGGPAAYTDVASGEIAIRNVADIYVFPNTLKVVKVTGAELKDWLERSAGIFNQIKSGSEEQLLINQAFPAYNFDVIDGVTYKIDVTQPSKFDLDGKPADANANRIRDLSFQGKPVQPADVFAVVSNNYRASGGGAFAGAVSKNIILDAPDYSRDIVSQFLAQAGAVSPKADGNWSLAPFPEATNVVFETGPQGKELAATRKMLTALPDGGNGFARFKIAP